VEVAAGEHVLLEGAHQGPGVLLELGYQRDLADARQVHPEPLQLFLQPVVGLVLTEVHRRDVRDDARVHPRARQHVLRPGSVDRGRLGRAREHRALVPLDEVDRRLAGEYLEDLHESRLHRTPRLRANQVLEIGRGHRDHLAGQRRVQGLGPLLQASLPTRPRRRDWGWRLRGDRRQRAHFTQEFIPLQIAVVTGTGPLLGFFAEQLGFQVLHPQFQPPDLRLLLRHLGGQIFGFVCGLGQ